MANFEIRVYSRILLTKTIGSRKKFYRERKKRGDSKISSLMTRLVFCLVGNLPSLGIVRVLIP